jgi:hypothetical protein
MKATPTAKKKAPTAAAKKKTDSKAVKENLGAIQTLAEFMATAGELSPEQRDQIIDQALILLEDFYVHLPLKRAMHAIEPVQRLKLLKQRQQNLSERAFHDEMISIYTHLRDLHTNYILPEPYRSRTAFVPFRLEAFFENGKRRYLVTQVSATVNDPNFKVGVVITHWNNIPIDRAVELNAEREAGSNLEARHARGVSAMTTRWMGMSLPPDEEKVSIRYLDGNKSREIEFEWQVVMPDTPATGIDLLGAQGNIAWHLGVDVKTEIERRILKLLFAPEAMACERRMANRSMNLLSAAAGNQPDEDDLAVVSTMPDVFSSFRTVETSQGEFGYIRIRTFNVSDDQTFIDEFIRLVRLLPQNGLIIDVRGNGGGLLPAGERLLQLLTPKRIEPARLHFINSPWTLKLCETNESLSHWKDSISQSVQTAAQFSQGFPILDPEDYNDIGQKYQGSVVLITDAMCYSTTDIFAAGFQDHEIGQILGTDNNTGAGGANVWTHDLLQQLLTDSPLQALPNGVSFRVAIRRTTRVGARAGVPVEDLGVTPDFTHPITKNDLLNGNMDLIEEAARIIKQKMDPAASLEAQLVVSNNQLSITATTKNVARVDVYLGTRPLSSLDVTDGETSFTLPKPAGNGNAIELRGYRNDQLVAATRLNISS